MKKSTERKIEMRYQQRLAELNKKYNEELTAINNKFNKDKENFLSLWEQKKKAALENVERLNKAKEENLDGFSRTLNLQHMDLKTQYADLKIEAKAQYIKELEEAETEE